MLTPPYLKPGDRVAIVATARKVNRDEMRPAMAMLRSWGLDVIEGDHLYHSENQYAGADEQRLADFQKALDDDSVRAVFCARGGYGTVRILDSLDFEAFSRNPKWVVGYSDITVLHSHINHNLGVETLHGPMPINFPADGKMDIAMHSLKDALWGNKLRYSFAGHKLNKPGQACGIVTGGNLSILYSLSGTPTDIFPGKQLLFLEDLDEYLYHVDRMMMNMLRSGRLANLAGLIVGGMTEMNDNEIPFGRDAEQIVSEATGGFDYPVSFGFQAGHIPQNLSLIMGREACLEVGERSILEFREA